MGISGGFRRLGIALGPILSIPLLVFLILVDEQHRSTLYDWVWIVGPAVVVFLFSVGVVWLIGWVIAGFRDSN